MTLTGLQSDGLFMSWLEPSHAKERGWKDIDFLPRPGLAGTSDK
jgi:hypothetical protein